MLFISLAFICLGSVSAVEEDNLNSTLETVNEISQDENIVINEINDENTDDTTQGESTVSVENEKEILKSSNDDVLSGTTTYLSLTELEKSDDSVKVRVEWTTDNNNFYNYYPYTKNVILYKNDDVNDVLYTFNSLTYATNSATGNVYYYGETSISLTGNGWFNITGNVASSYSGSPTYDSATSNTLSYYIGTMTADTTTTLNIEKDANDNTKVTITPTVQTTDDNTVITTADSVEIYINGAKYGNNIAADGNVVYTNSEENTYSVYAHFIGDDENSESNSTIYLFTLGTTNSPVNLSISLNTTGIAPGGSLKITPNVLDGNGNPITGTVDIYEVETDSLVISGISNNVESVYTPDESTHTAGSTYQLYAVFTNDGTYARATSSKLSYIVKKQLTMTLYVDEDTTANISTSGSSYTYVNFKVVFDDDSSEDLYLYYGTDLDNMNKIAFDGDEDIGFQSYYSYYKNYISRGLNYVYVEFEGNDTFLESQSTTVTMGVYQPVSVSVSLSPNYGLEKTTVTVTPSVTYSSNSISGTLKLYSDSARTNLIASVETGDGATFDYTVPENTGSSASTSTYIYYTFEGYDNTNYYYYSASSYTTFYSMNENTLTITGKNSTGDAQSEIVQIEEGGSVTFSVTNLDYKYSYSTTNVYLYVEGVDGSVATFPTSGYYGTTLGNLTFTFDTTNYPNKEYTVYAVYEGYSNQYAPATSNSIKVQIGSQDEATTVTLTTTDSTTIKQGQSITITPTITPSVSEGTITYYNGTDALTGWTDVAYNTPFTTEGLAVGTYSISAKYNGATGYAASELSDPIEITVNPADGFTISVSSPTYPTHAVATVTGEEGETYTITISEVPSLSFEVTIPAGETSVSQDLDLLDVAATYTAVVTKDDESNQTTFSVRKGTPTLTVTAEGNNTAIGETHTITVSSDVSGKITLNTESGEFDVGVAITLSNLVSGSNEITITLTPTDTNNYENAVKTINFVIEKTNIGTYIVLEMDTDSFSYSPYSSISAIAHVYDDNNQEVNVGTVTFTPSDSYNGASTIAPGATKSISDSSNSINNGKYTLTVKYNGGSDDNYIYSESETITADYYRVTAPTSIVLTVDSQSSVETYAGETVVLHATVSSTSSYYDGSEISTALQLFVNGIESDVVTVNANTDVNFVIPEGYSGEYNLSVKYSADNDENRQFNYPYRYGSSASNNITLNVGAKTTPKLTIDTQDGQSSYVYDNAITIVPTFDEDISGGTVTYYIDDEAQDPIAYNANFIIDKLAVKDSYTIYAVYSGYGVYSTATSNSITVNVTKGQNTVTVDADDVTLPDGKITVHVTANVPGTYTVELNDTGKTQITVVVSEANVEATNTSDVKLAAGKYSATTRFEDDNYDATLLGKDFEVKKSINEIYITATSVSYPDMVNIKVSAEVEGTYNVKVGEIIIPVTANSEEGVYYQFGASSDQYYATVEGWTHDDYEASVTLASFTVSKGSNTVVVEVSDVTLPDGRVTAKVTATVPGTYVVTLNDTANTQISVEVTAADVAASNSTSTKIAAGHYSANTTFADHENYTVSITNATFDVNKAINNIVVGVTSVTYPNEVTVTVTATVDGTYNVKVGETTIPVTANGDGVTYKFPASSDSYTATVEGWTDDDYEASVTPAEFTVSKGSNTVVVEVSDVTLPDGRVTARVTATVPGTYVVTLNDTANTQISVEVTAADVAASNSTSTKIAAGHYSANTTFDDDNYDASITNDTFTVKKGTISLQLIIGQIVYGNNVTGSIVTDVDGEYYVTIDGRKRITVNTAEGNTFSTEMDLAVSDTEYQAYVSIYNLDDYNDASYYTQFKVVQTETDFKANASKEEYTYGEDVILVISDIPDEATGKVTFKYANGTSAGEIENIYTTKELNIGTPNAATSQYTITATYAGDSNYAGGAERTFSFKVNKKANDVTVSIENIKYAQDLTVSLSNAAAGEYIVTIDGKEVKVAVDATGTGTNTTALDLAVKNNYEAGISFDNANYETSGSATFNVTQATNTIKVTVNPAEVTYGSAVTVKVEADVSGTYTVNINGNSAEVSVGDSLSGEKEVNLDLDVSDDEYTTSTSWSNANYTASITEASFKVVKATNKVVIAIENAEYGSDITVKVTADKNGTYTVKLDDTHSVDVAVSADGETGTNTASVDLAVKAYQATTSFDNTNYDTQVSGGSFSITAKTNTVKITVESPVNYGDNVTVSVEATVPDTYTITIGTETIDVKVEDSSKKVTASLDLAQGTYVATTSWSNDNYTLSLTEGSLTVNPATNNVVVEIADVTLPDEVTVYLTANLTGTYRVYFNTTAYVDIEATANTKASATYALAAGTYNPIVEAQFSNANYTISSQVTGVTVSAAALEADLKLRVQGYLDNESELTITFSDSYSVSFVYYLEKPDAEINSDEIILYYNGSPVNLAITVKEDEYTGFTTVNINEEGSMTLKLIYNATLKDGSVFTQESNELKVTFVKEEITGDDLQIRDHTYQENSTVTLVSNDNITVTIDYYLVEPDNELMSSELRIYMGSDENYIYEGYATGASWVSNTYMFNETGDYTVYAVYTGKIGISMQEVTYTSNEIVYHITINREESDTDNISIESKEVDYGSKANLTVSGTDGDYTVTVNKKDYDVSVENGIGYAVIDVLAGNKTYEVSIVSKTNESLVNSSTLTVNAISPKLNITATDTKPTYGEAITITASKNTTATGDIKFYEGDDEISVVDVILAGGSHTITAKYAADGNFTYEEAEITIDVEKATNELTLTVTNETYPDNVTITLKATVAGEYTVMIGTVEVPVTVGDTGVGTASVKLNPNSGYAATVDFADDGNYFANSASYTFHVDGDTVGLKVTPQEATVEFSESIELNSSTENPATGKVTYKSDDGWTVEADIGEVVEYTPQTVGTHTVEVTYDDGIYDPQTVTVTVTVSKKQNKIKVEVSGSTYPDNVTVKVTADVEGDYTVDINGISVTVTANGEGKSVKLDAGSYYANVTYSSDEYDGIITNATFEVKQAENNVEVTIESVEYGQPITVTVKADKPGVYTVKFDDENSVNVTVGEDGTGNETVSLTLNAAEYTPTVIFEDKNYEINKTGGDFEITQATPEFKANSSEEKYDYGGEVIIKVTLPSDATGTLTVSYENGTVITEKELLGNGLLGVAFGANLLKATDSEYSISLGTLAEGEYNIVAKYSGNDNYKEVSQDISFEVVSEEDVNASVTVVDYDYQSNSTITLSSDGNITVQIAYRVIKPDDVSSDGMTLYIGDESLYVDSPVDGYWYGTSYTFNETGDYVVKVVYKATIIDSNFQISTVTLESDSITYHIKINEATESTLTVETESVKDNVNATVTVKSNVAGEYIVSVNGTDYTVTIGDSGENSTTINQLAAGTYEVTVTAKDNSSFTNSTTLTVTDSSVPDPDSLTVEVSETTYPGAAIVTVKSNVAGEYTVSVNGTDYTVTIGDSGENSTEISVLPAGDYTVTVTAKDNSSFTNETALTVAKGKNNIKIEADSVTLPANVTVKVTADLAGTYTIILDDSNNVTVTIAVDGGSASEVVALAAGTYTPELSGYVDDNYNAVVDADSFTVSEEAVNASVTVVDYDYQSNSTITLSSDGNITVQIAYKVIKPDDVSSDGMTLYIGDKSLYIDSPVDNYWYGTSYTFNETGDYIVKLVYNATLLHSDLQIEYFSLESDSITYHIKINETIENTLSVETESVKDNVNATVTVKSNVAGEYIVSVNGTDYTVVIGDSGENSTTINQLAAGTYEVTVTAKDNSSFTNSTTLTVTDSSVPDPDSLTVEVSETTYPGAATVTVKSNVAGDYTVSVNGTDYTVTIGEDGVNSTVINVLPAGTYDVTVISNDNASFTNSTTLTVAKGKNNIKIEAGSVTLPANVTVKVTADLAGTYTIKVGDETINVTIASNGGSASEVVALAAGTYTPELSGYVDDNYDAVVDADSFTVSEEDVNASVIVVDYDYQSNSTITLSSDGNITVNIAYKVIKPDDVSSDGMTLYIGDESLYIDSPVDNYWYGTSYTFNETGDYVVKVVYKATTLDSNFQFSDVTLESNSITYHIKINETIESTLSVETESVKDNVNATVTVKSNVAGEYIVSVNGTDYTVVIGDSGENSTTINQLAAGTYEVTVTAKDNSSFTNSTTLTVTDSSVPDPDSLTVEVSETTYPGAATVTVKSNVAGVYTVSVNGTDYAITIGEDGVNSTVINVLPAGTYDVTVISNDNASFTNTTTLTVAKGKNNIKIEADSVILPANVTVKVTADLAGTYTIKVGDETINVTIAADGGSASEVVALAAGTYTPELSGYADDNYDAVVDSSIFTVSEEVIGDIVLIIRDATYTSNSTITISSNENVTITLQYYFTKPDEILVSPEFNGYINGEHLAGFGLYEYEKIVNASYSTFGTLYNISESCELDIYVVFTSEALSIFGNAYNVESNHIKYIIKINETPVVEEDSLTVEAASVNDQTNATVVVKTNVAGEYIVSVNDVDYPVNVTGTEASVTVAVLPANNYTVTVKSKNNASFTNTTTLVVSETPAADDKTLSVETSDVNDTTNATVVVKTNTPGDYIVSVGGVDYPVTVSGTEASVVIAVLPANTYTVTVTAKDNASFTNTTTLVVSETPVNPDVPYIIIRDIGGNNSTITVTGNDNVTITIQYFVVIPNGDANAPSIMGYINGEHPEGFAVTYAGDIVYAEFTNIVIPGQFNESTVLDVYVTFNSTELLGAGGYNLESNHLKYLIYINETPVCENTTLSVEVSSPTSEENATVTVKTNKAGEYIVNVNGTDYPVTVSDTEATVTLPVLPAGEYTVTVTAKDNASIKNTTTLTVSEAQKITDYNITGEISSTNDDELIISLPENATGTVSVKIGDEIINATVENGKAVIDLSDIAAGNYTAEVSYSGDDNYAPSVTTVAISLSKYSTVICDIVFNGNNNISAVLKDVNGNAIANAEITYSIAGVSGNTTTDASGKFTIEATANNKVNIVYAGSSRYSAVNTSLWNNVTKARLGSGFNFTNGFVYTTLAVDYTPGERGSWFECLLTDSNGSPIANADVYFGINGFIHNKTSDENGLVRLQINLKEANTYTCAVSFLGDDNYNASFAVAKLVVKKKTTSIKASAKKYKASAKTKKYTVTLKTVKGASADGKTYLQSNKKVTLKVNGKTYIGKTNAKGKVTFKLKLTKKGKYTAKIKFAGDKTYSASSKSVKITIK